MAVLWAIFERVRTELRKRGLLTLPEMYSQLAAHVSGRRHPPFEFVVVDEAQDVRVPQLKFLAALGGQQPNGLFFTGDLGQRIFQQPFSWKALEVEIRGRAHTLKVNYRTSHQIRKQADRLLGLEVADVDGNIEVRGGTVSVFNGPVPTIRVMNGEVEETQAVSDWLSERKAEGLLPHEIGCSFARRHSLGGPRPPSKRPVSLIRSSMTGWKQPAVTSPSVPCTWPRAWSSASWP